MDYDIAIIGGGITGASALYVLSNYTNVKKIVLFEKYDELATGVSNNKNNSQTLHFGDIETNYTVKKAEGVKKGAEMMAKYVDNHPKEKLARKAQKMALALGDKEVKEMKQRYKDFKKLFPEVKLIGRKELEKVEPSVVKGRDPDVDMVAMYNKNGYIMDYGGIAKSLVKNSKNSKVIKSKKIKNIEKIKDGFKVNGITAKTVIVATGSYSLKFAHDMGYGKNLIILPVAGRFFLGDVKMKGKVYMMQNPALPFAAIHADPDVHKPNETRFGPVAKILPMLETGRYASILDYLSLLKLNWPAVNTLLHVGLNPVYLKYMIIQVFYSLPVIGKLLYLKEARKIVPSIKYEDINRAKGYGGIRPQIMNTSTKKVEFGAGKVVGDRILFDITPSPGASMGLKNAYETTLQVMSFLGKGYKFDEKKFKKDYF